MVTPGVMTARGQTFIRRLKLKGAGSMESVASKRQSVGNDPFGIVAAIIRQVWKKLNDLENRHKWWTRLNHRLLIFISIGCGFYRKSLLPDAYHPTYVYTREKLADLLIAEVSQTSPEEALALHDLLDTFVPRLSFAT